MGNALRHSEPIYRNRPVRYDQYVETGKLENEEPLYRREQKLLADNPVPYCGICGRRLCSRFTNYCPAWCANVDFGGETDACNLVSWAAGRHRGMGVR